MDIEDEIILEQISTVVNDRFSFNMQRFEKITAGLQGSGLSYRTYEYGGTKIIDNLRGKKYRIMMNNKFLRGSHLIRLVRDDLNKKVSAGLVFKNKNIDRHRFYTVFFNESGIKSLAAGCNIEAVDINSCYWNTLHILNYSTDRLYEQGYKFQKEYKTARNVSIGCLGKMERRTSYDSATGEHTEGFYKSPLACARMDIIDHVYNTCIVIAKELGDDFLYFLSDCFFVKSSALERVQELIAKAGYTSKRETVRFSRFERKNRMSFKVYWYKDGAISESYQGFVGMQHDIVLQMPI